MQQAHAMRENISPCPSSWYLVERSASVRPGKIVPAKIGADDLVLFRSSNDNQVHALAAHCIHMGCHLRAGQIVGDHIRCPLHFREFDGSGRCRSPGTPPQPTYPTIERFGAVFVFIGGEPVFDLPAPHQQPAEYFATLITKSFEFPLPWHALVANGCDLDHLQTVHRRRLRERPTVGLLSPGVFHLRYRTEVTGRSVADRLMRWISRNDIRAAISCYGGSLMLVESQIGDRQSFLLMSMRPTRDATSIRGIVGLPRRGGDLIAGILVRFAAWLFLAFLKRDFEILEGLRLHRPTPILTDGDRYMSELFDYFVSLDQNSARLGTSVR
jgi:aminopyrrolnitrin oxygenase